MESYTTYLVARGLAPETIRAYTASVHRITAWLDTNGTGLSDATAAQIAAYADTLAVSHSIRGQLRSALKHWYESQTMSGPHRAVRVPPQPDLVCRALEDDEARAVVKTAVGWWPQGTAALLGLYLALRRTEIAAAEWSRYDPAGGGWYRVTGKRSRTATLPVHPVLVAELDVAPNEGRWVFPGRYVGCHITPATVWAWVAEVTDAAGVGPVTTHRLRHTALATANDRTGDLRAVQTFARHQSPRTTAGYTRTTRQRLRETVDALDYLG